MTAAPDSRQRDSDRSWWAKLNDPRWRWGRVAPELHHFTQYEASRAIADWKYVHRVSKWCWYVVAYVTIVAGAASSGVSAMPWALPVVYFAMCTAVITFPLARRNSLRRHLRQWLIDEGTPICINCGYDLHGLSEARCPECGAEFHPRLRSTQLTHASDTDTTSQER